MIPSLNVIRGGRHFDTPVRRVGDAGKQNGASSEEKREKCSRGIGKKNARRLVVVFHFFFLCVARVLVNAGVSGLRATCRERTGPQKRKNRRRGHHRQSDVSAHTRDHPSSQASVFTSRTLNIFPFIISLSVRTHCYYSHHST